jgi:hypothetical protein
MELHFSQLPLGRSKGHIGQNQKKTVGARWTITEIVILGATIAIGLVLNWKFWVFFLPFCYLGHFCRSPRGQDLQSGRIEAIS